MLKKYHPDPSHVLQPENIEIDEALTYEEKPVKLLDRKVKELKNKQIFSVKVLWRNHGIRGSNLGGRRINLKEISRPIS